MEFEDDDLFLCEIGLVGFRESGHSHGSCELTNDMTKNIIKKCSSSGTIKKWKIIGC